MKAKTISRPLTVILAALSLIAVFQAAGCKSAPRAGQCSNFSAGFSPGNDGNTECTLRDRLLPGSLILGTAAQDTSGKWIISVEKVKWFNNWSDGWSEAMIVASGTLSLELTAPENPALGWTVTVIEGLKLEYASTAMIRYRDKILYGDQAVEMFNRRIERVKTAGAFLGASLSGRTFMTVKAERKKSRDTSFEYCAGSILFPELYGYPEGTAESPNLKENRSHGEGLTWDTGYSDEHLDPVLKDVRDSGTLYRDWEESVELFYFLAVPWIDLPSEYK